MSNKPLIMHLNKEFYDMVKQGYKCIEYREDKPYWWKQLKGKKQILFLPGYPKNNNPSILVNIDDIKIVSKQDLPAYAQEFFKKSKYDQFLAIYFTLVSYKESSGEVK